MTTDPLAAVAADLNPRSTPPAQPAQPAAQPAAQRMVTLRTTTARGELWNSSADIAPIFVIILIVALVLTIRATIPDHDHDHEPTSPTTTTTPRCWPGWSWSPTAGECVQRNDIGTAVPMWNTTTPTTPTPLGDRP